MNEWFKHRLTVSKLDRSHKAVQRSRPTYSACHVLHVAYRFCTLTMVSLVLRRDYWCTARIALLCAGLALIVISMLMLHTASTDAISPLRRTAVRRHDGRWRCKNARSEHDAVDSLGHLCAHEAIGVDGCCRPDTRKTRSTHDLQDCPLCVGTCCSTYTACVACCTNNGGEFERCVPRCRTDSGVTLHENAYRGPHRFCWRGVPPLDISYHHGVFDFAQPHPAHLRALHSLHAWVFGETVVLWPSFVTRTVFLSLVHTIAPVSPYFEMICIQSTILSPVYQVSLFHLLALSQSKCTCT